CSNARLLTGATDSGSRGQPGGATVVSGVLSYAFRFEQPPGKHRRAFHMRDKPAPAFVACVRVENSSPPGSPGCAHVPPPTTAYDCGKSGDRHKALLPGTRRP